MLEFHKLLTLYFAVFGIVLTLSDSVKCHLEIWGSIF